MDPYLDLDDCFVLSSDRPRRSVPRVKAIAAHWGRSAGRCWRCHFEYDQLERAHLVDRCYGGLDHAGNLALLCGMCHRYMPSFGPNRWEQAIAYAMPDDPGIDRIADRIFELVDPIDVERIFRNYPTAEATEMIRKKMRAAL